MVTSFVNIVLSKVYILPIYSNSDQPLNEWSQEDTNVIRVGTIAKVVAVAVAALAVGNQAQSQNGQVVVIGDSVAYQWAVSSQFQAHSAWSSVASPTAGASSVAAGSTTALHQLQNIVAMGRKPIVIMEAGEADTEYLTQANEHSSVFAEFAYNLDKIGATAQAAGIHLILATIPYSIGGDKSSLNQWIFSYAAAHSIPVVNFDFALNGGTGFAASGFSNPANAPSPSPKPVYWAPSIFYAGVYVPEFTDEGFALMTDMADLAVAQVEGATLTGGYLGTVEYGRNVYTDLSVVGVNYVVNGGIVQFTPYGEYSDGSTHVFNNADQYGHIGTWTNSSPNVMTLDQNGVAIGLNRGQSTVHFTSTTGEAVNEWVETVQPSEYGCGDCITY